VYKITQTSVKISFNNVSVNMSIVMKKGIFNMLTPLGFLIYKLIGFCFVFGAVTIIKKARSTKKGVGG
jgi:hypothetical protein